MGLQTPLHGAHQQLEARIVDFGGWDMPLHYGSQLEEHHQVRQGAGMFDVSHMTVVDVSGVDARRFLRHLLANDIDKITALGGALYSCMLNEQGGVVDDLIVYWMGSYNFRLVVNAATREKDLAWISGKSEPFDVGLQEREDLAMIAAQGPEARERVAQAAPAPLATALMKVGRFKSLAVGKWQFARTGYTGEDGFEVILPADEAEKFWAALAAADVRPCGLGARDTLRLEAGLNLYGQDMDETTSPLISNLAWTIAWDPADRDFVGRTALEQEKAKGIDQALVGLVLGARGVLRHGQVVQVDGGTGVVTSGGFGPSVEASVALARLPATTATQVAVDIRGKALPAQVVKPPFIRAGIATFTR